MLHCWNTSKAKNLSQQTSTFDSINYYLHRLGIISILIIYHDEANDLYLCFGGVGWLDENCHGLCSGRHGSIALDFTGRGIDVLTSQAGCWIRSMCLWMLLPRLIQSRTAPTKSTRWCSLQRVDVYHDDQRVTTNDHESQAYHRNGSKGWSSCLVSTCDFRKYRQSTSSWVGGAWWMGQRLGVTKILSHWTHGIYQRKFSIFTQFIHDFDLNIPC